MAYGEITVGDLRKAIEGMDDHSVVLVKRHDESAFLSCELYSTTERGVRVTVPGRPARVWNYNTRVIHNAYTANDDRFNISQILLLEIGEEGP